MPIIEIKLGAEEITTFRFWRAVLAEFLGTLLFLVCVTSVALSWGSKSTIAGQVSANNVEVAIGIGLAIATLAQAFGHVSGGHLNPAVTFGMVFGGRTSILKGVFYILAQMVGGVAGSGIVYGCTPDNRRGALGATFLRTGVRTGHGFALEMIFTFILVFFVFSVTDPKKKVEPYGQTLGIGVCIMVAHVCLVPFTNCGINPARSFGPSVVTNTWDDHWIYWVAPMTGGFLASIMYNAIFYVDDEDVEGEKYEVKRQQSAIPLQTAGSV